MRHAPGGGAPACPEAGAFLTEIWIVFAIIAGVIGLFVWDRLPVIAVCVGCAMALWATGVLTLNQALAGFGDPATIFVTSLFVVAGALEKTGLTAWTGQMLARGSGASRFRLIVLMMLFCGVLSALISVNGAVAALLPVVVVLAVRLKRPPSQLLMPLVFGAHAGSMLALTGTPVNVLVLEASLDAGQRRLRLLRVRLRRRLPRHRHHPHRAPARLAAAAGAREPVAAARPQPPRPHARRAVPARRRGAPAPGAAGVAAGRPAAGRARSRRTRRADAPDAAGGGGQRRGAARADRGGRPDGGARRRRGGGRARRRAGAEPAPTPRGSKFEAGLFTTASGLAEVVIPPRSPLIGERLFPGMVTPSGNLVVLAIHRQHHDLPPGEPLDEGRHAAAAGDLGRRSTTYIAPPEALVVDSPELVRRQVAADGPRGADRARRHGGDGAAARDRAGAGGGRRPPRRRRDPRSSASSTPRRSTARSTGRR